MYKALVLVKLQQSYNRTFMELKSQDPNESTLGKAGFNRTFMELKLSGLAQGLTQGVF